MNELTIELEIASGKCGVFVHFTVFPIGDFVIERMTSARDDDGEKTNLYPLLNIKSIRDAVEAKVKGRIKELSND